MRWLPSITQTHVASRPGSVPKVGPAGQVGLVGGQHDSSVVGHLARAPPNGGDVRNLPLYLNAQAEHILDWFHVTMRLTALANMAKALRTAPPDEEGLPSPPGPAVEV